MKARFFAIAALVLGLASCQQDFAPDTQPSGGEVSVQLVVSAPELIGATRAGEDGKVDGNMGMDSAFGAIDYLDGAVVGDYRFDWDDVNIRYTMEVYDVNDLSKPIKDRQEQITDKYEPVQFEVRLIPDRKYQFVVFADFIDQTTGAALRHQIGATLNDITLINKSGEELNDEVADCYFKSWEFSPENNTQNQTEATLTRPYAKVRVIATDLDELNLNVHPENVAIEYDAVIPTAFNAVTGSISGDNTTKNFNYNYIAEVRDNMANHVYNANYDALVDTETGRATHMTLFTDYILAEDEQSSIHFKMTVSDKIGPIKVVDFNTEIPIQRNYLTTVIGNVLTTNTQVDITINDNFDGYFTIDNFNVVYNAEQLQNALDNLVEGNNTIVFGDDIEGNVNIEQVEGKNVVIDGAKFKYDGSIFIDGNARFGGAETVLFKNINFETSTPNIDFVYNNEKGGTKAYAHNITFNNCSFNATGDTVVGIRFRQGYNIVIEDCVANGTTRAAASGLHSLGQLPGCTGVTINNVNVDALEGGFNLTTSTNVTIKNSTIVARDYAVRVDASHADDRNILNIENVDFTAKYPVVARYFTANYTINFAGDNKLTAPGYQVVLTAVKDDMTLVAPTGEYTLTGAEDFAVFPGNVLYAYNQADLQYLLDNAVDGNIIRFAEDIKGNVLVNQSKDKDYIIDGNGKKLEGYIEINGDARQADPDSVTIKNIKFTTSENDITFIDANDNTKYGNKYNYAHNIYVESCSFEGAGENVMGLKLRQAKNVVIKDCVVNVGHSLAQLYGCNGVTIDGVEVKAGRGISLGTSTNCVVKDSTFDVVKYGLRAEPTSTLTIENSNIKAAEPVIVRKLTKGSYDITIDNSSVLESGNEFQIVFTNGDDGVTYVIPAGTFVINDNNNFKVYPRDIIADLQYNGETKSFEAQNALGLAAIVNSVNNGENDFAGFTVTLSEDIDLQGVEFQPIGTADNKFNGTFDGQGKTISNLKIENDNMGAMFAYVGANTVIKNFNLENVDIKAKFAAGILSEGNDNVVVEDITVSGNVEGDSYAAGIVCLNSYNEDPAVVIKNCVNNATVSGNRAGGIAAWLTGNSVIENVVNNGNITGTTSAAGITNRIAGSIKNAKNYGTIVGNGSEASAGIAGTQTAASTYEYCYNYGNVTTTKDNPNSSAAGILGQTPSAKATFNYCANYGAITAEQSYAAGIGYSLYGGIVANYCYNEGAVNGADGAGAIAPKAQYGGSNNINYCLDGGVATATAAINAKGKNVYTSCYYYNNGELLNVADNTVADVTAALTVLNGGADAEFFTNENGVIVVK